LNPSHLWSSVVDQRYFAEVPLTRGILQIMKKRLEKGAGYITSEVKRVKKLKDDKSIKVGPVPFYSPEFSTKHLLSLILAPRY